MAGKALLGQIGWCGGGSILVTATVSPLQTPVCHYSQEDTFREQNRALLGKETVDGGGSGGYQSGDPATALIAALPPKLVKKITSLEFLDMSELLSKTWRMEESPHHVRTGLGYGLFGGWSHGWPNLWAWEELWGDSTASRLGQTSIPLGGVELALSN